MNTVIICVAIVLGFLGTALGMINLKLHRLNQELWEEYLTEKQDRR